MGPDKAAAKLAANDFGRKKGKMEARLCLVSSCLEAVAGRGMYIPTVAVPPAASAVVVDDARAAVAAAVAAAAVSAGARPGPARRWWVKFAGGCCP